MRKLFIDEEDSEPGENIRILEGTPENAAAVGEVFNFYHFPCLEFETQDAEKEFDNEAIALARLFASAPRMADAIQFALFNWHNNDLGDIIEGTLRAALPKEETE